MNSFSRLLIGCLAIVGWVAVENSIADPQGDEERREMWESLSDEEKEKLRTALRDVWTDPAVINAREEVKTATDAYQKAIREAVAKADPSVAGLMAKAEKNSEGRMGDRIGGPPGGRTGMFRRGGDYPMSPPGFMEKLSPEEQEKFRKAEAEAKKTPEVQEALEAFKVLGKQDEALRRKRLEAHRQMRQAILNAMVKADPSIKELQDRLEFPSYGRGGKGGAKGKAEEGAKEKQ